MPERRQQSSQSLGQGKGQSNFILPIIFILLGLIGMMVFSYSYWTKAAHSKTMIAKLGSDRVTKAANMLATYQGNGSLELNFAKPYQFKIKQDKVVATYQGVSEPTYFSVPVQVKQRDIDQTRGLTVIKKSKQQADVLIFKPGSHPIKNP